MNDPVFVNFLKFTFPFWFPILFLYLSVILVYEIVSENRRNRRLVEEAIKKVAWV